MTVAAGAGHGSGVLIAADGLVLTAAAVVGEAERVRVVLASGAAHTGDVLRRDRVRGVALVAIPGSGHPALPVRTRPLAVSEEVYAVSAPARGHGQGTVMRGIVSSLRRERLTGLVRIEADILGREGATGGPLLDGRGNLAGIGIAAGHAGDALGADPVLQGFIPITDALYHLDLALAGPPATP